MLNVCRFFLPPPDFILSMNNIYIYMNIYIYIHILMGGGGGKHILECIKKARKKKGARI